MDELLSGRTLPHSAEAEQAVIGSMLIDPRCVADVISAVRPADFYIDANRDIYETIYTMFNYSVVIDPVTVLDNMKQRGVFNERTSSTYILELMNLTPTAENVLEYAAIVKDKAKLRSLVEAATEISELVYSEAGTADDILELAEKKIYAVRSGSESRDLQPISSIMLSVYDRLSEIAEREEDIPGLSTGLHDLDRYILGLNNSDLILIASRPGMGKTSIAMNIALHVGKYSGLAVAVFSLEMSREQLAMRLISSESFVDNKKMQTGRLSEEEWRKIGLAAASISKTQIYVNDNPSITVAEMNAQCRRVKDLGLIIIDYLQLMQSASGRVNSGENRTQVVGEISRMLKIMAKESNVPVICLSQLNRASATRSDKRPVLSDLRESGSIEQDADIVMGLYRDDYYGSEAVENPNLAELIILKNRHGETGTIELQWLPEFTTYSSIDKRHNEEDYN